MKKDIMKRATAMLLGVALSASFILTSCDKMLDVDSDRQAFEPDMNSKTDSVFYAFGIAQAMQQLADQYFYQGEMRGELVATTQYTDSMLSQLKNFSAGLNNRYDSAYVYYRVINNCNYYIKHRNTDLRTGSTDVTINEFAAVKAYRAWAYLQLARNYGKVPFFTEPLTNISEISQTFPEYDIYQIADALCPDLAQYSGIPVPNYGTNINIGNVNGGGTKYMNTTRIFIPVDVILGDLYLETGKYTEAANSYFNYLQTTKTLLPDVQTVLRMRDASLSYPSDYASTNNNVAKYQNIFTLANSATCLDIVSYIPMAANQRMGTTTSVPLSFGYDFYALSSSARWREDIQLTQSKVYNDLVDGRKETTGDANGIDFYYYKQVSGGLPKKDLTTGKYGDMRSLSNIYPTRGSSYIVIGDDDESKTEWIDKFRSANIIVYRATTVYLHLCEALNRMGLPDAAFAFLKEGLTDELVKTTTTWLSDDAKNYFNNTFFNATNVDTYKSNTLPIHQHGCGATPDGNYPGSSPYQFSTEIGRKFAQLATNATLYPGLASRVSSSTTTKADTIMAMEELLCDEEAMEFCFEGTRWYDLMRFARHKNRAGLQGNAWLADKVKSNSPVVNLLDEDNWYLPLKK